MNLFFKFLISGLWFISSFLCCKAGIYVVSTAGNDGNPGTAELPLASVSTAISRLAVGDTVLVRGGKYDLTSTIVLGKSGTSLNYYYVMAWPGERPVFDFSGQSMAGSSRGILISASYWHLEGISVCGAGDNGLKIENGHFNRIVNCAFYRNRDSGLQMGKGSSNNMVINCDSYYNADPPDYGDADGFAAKLDVGKDNYFYGCRAWKNCDDGWDGYLRGADNVSTILENCWAFENGYLENGEDPGPAANGNGFKMGGSDDKTLRHDFLLKNCLAFGNKAKGFDQNSNMGSMILFNCTGVHNLGDNFKIYKEIYAGEELVLKNCAELGNKLDIGEFATEETNSWMEFFTVSEEDFISLDNQDAIGQRKPDGLLPDIFYMHLAGGSDLIDAGVDVGLPFMGSAPDLGCFETCSGLNVNNLPDNGRLIIYPNPASGECRVRIPGTVSGGTVLVLRDLTGKVVFRKELNAFPLDSEMILNIDNYSKGIYLLELITGGRILSGKLIIR